MSDPYFYDIGYASEESCDYEQWQHHEQYSEGELTTIVLDVCAEVLISVAKSGDERTVHCLGAEFPMWCSILSSLEFKEAFKKRGFVSVEFQARVVFDGFHVCAKPDTGPKPFWDAFDIETAAEVYEKVKDVVHVIAEPGIDPKYPSYRLALKE